VPRHRKASEPGGGVHEKVLDDVDKALEFQALLNVGGSLAGGEGRLARENVRFVERRPDSKRACQPPSISGMCRAS
jgi:hypothetical protein